MIVLYRLTAPGGTCEDDGARAELRKLPVKDFKAVSLDPGDFLRDAVYLGVLFGTSYGVSVLFDGEDLGPPIGARKGNGVSTDAGETVNNDGLCTGCGVGHVLGNSAGNSQKKERKKQNAIKQNIPTMLQVLESRRTRLRLSYRCRRHT